MTEAEWLECSKPLSMLEFLAGKASDRKLRLFAVACYRHAWHLLITKRAREAVEWVEGFADGVGTKQQLHDWGWLREHGSNAAALFKAMDSATTSAYSTADRVAWAVAEADPEKNRTWESIFDAEHAKGWMISEAMAAADQGLPDGAGWVAAREAARHAEFVAQGDLLRDIFNNPFEPPTLDSTWLVPTIIKLAQQIYSERTFDQLPKLADLLESANCKDAHILGHCRGSRNHVRGCWVVDLVLGKD
jgi:hypothetical protein